MKIAKERKSSVLASNAVHHRIDCLTSIVALVAIGGSHLLPDASWLDPTGGLLVSLMVVRAGWANTRAALLELADVGIDAEVIDSIRKATSRAMEVLSENDELSLRNVQGVKAGQNYLVEIELAVPGSWTVDRTRIVEGAVRQQVGSTVRGIRRVKVRFVAKNSELPDSSDEFISPEISPRSSPEPGAEKGAKLEKDSHDHVGMTDLRDRRHNNVQ